jgi:tetratricopeptide (TPR) repeat protein
MGTHFLGRNIAILLLLSLIACNNRDQRVVGDFSLTDTILVDISNLADLLNNEAHTSVRKSVIEGLNHPVKNNYALDSFLSANPYLIKEIFIFEDADVQENFLINADLNNLSNTLITASNFVIAKSYQSKSVLDLAYFFRASESLDTKNIDSLEFYIDLVDIDSSKILNQFFRPAYHNVLASYHQLNGNYFQAFVNFHLALQSMPASNVEEISQLYHNLAGLYGHFQYYEKADSIMEYSIRLLPLVKTSMLTKNTLGTIKMRIGKLDSAQVLFEGILSDPEISYQPRLRAMVFSNLGNVNRRSKSFDRALHFFDKSDSVCAANSIEVGFLVNAINRAEVYLDLNQLAMANKELNKALDYLTRFPIKNFEVETYRLLIRYYDNNANTAKANEFFRKYTLAKDELMGDETKSILAEWELNNERSAHQLENLLKEQEAVKLRGQRNLTLLSSGILLIAIVFFFVNKQRNQLLVQEKTLREKEKLEFNLELRSKELLVETMKNFTVQNTKAGIGTLLSELVETLPKIHQAKFKDLQYELRSRKEVSHFKEFDQRFTSIHENFYQSLNALAPDLSPSEMRICALMRMNMTTKDIANLTNRTPGRVDNVRSAIRKKLQLSDNENLQSFIMKI